MTAMYSAPIWLLFMALVLPLLIISSSAFDWSRAFPNSGMPRRYATMTDQQGRLISAAHHDSKSGVVWYFGPLAIAANARAWAALAVMIGLLLTGIGMIGLLHFPTQQPMMHSEATTSVVGDDQATSLSSQISDR